MNRSFLIFIIVPLVGFPVILWKFAPSHWTITQIIYLLITLFGLVLLTTARIQLGTSFSLTPQARKLVTRGLYSRVRHPVYVFGSIAILGLFLYMNRPLLLLVFILILPMQILRARAEERVLEARFGDEYRAYKASTWF